MSEIPLLALVTPDTNADLMTVREVIALSPEASDKEHRGRLTLLRGLQPM